MKKTIVITGGTGGIGSATAKVLALQGHKIIIQGMNPEHSTNVLQQLQKETGGEITLLLADLSSKEGIRKFAQEVKKATKQIDILVHSTGRLNSTRRETIDGYDEGFVINYLNKFMLNDLLLEELKQGNGQIIIVGAPLIKGADINFNDLHLKQSYSLISMMKQAQFAVHLHAQEFARKNGKHPIINVIHPGVVASGIGRNLHPIMNLLYKLAVPLIGNSAKKAVANIIELANSNTEITGYFFPKLNNIQEREKLNHDNGLAEKLWSTSVYLCNQ